MIVAYLDAGEYRDAEECAVAEAFGIHPLDVQRVPPTRYTPQHEDNPACKPLPGDRATEYADPADPWGWETEMVSRWWGQGWTLEWPSDAIPSGLCGCGCEEGR